MADATRLLSEVIPAGVRAFAVEHKVEKYLLPVYEMTKRLFPTARRLEVCLEPDPSIADFWYIVYEVEVPGMEVKQAVATEWQWCEELGKCCPTTPGCSFCLSTRLGP